ncbi:hypothetical protein [Ralstonia sp. UBA689]|uniref:hypothetical protein n=1 Tax=Ralstonia sp. UBA689 TaxID=1947373 RepID=UPI0039C98C72
MKIRRRAAPACADMPGSLEKHVPLERDPCVTTVGTLALQRHELSLDQRLDIGSVQFSGLGTIVDQEQDGKFMGTQHS